MRWRSLGRVRFVCTGYSAGEPGRRCALAGGAAWPRIYDSHTSPCFFRYAIVTSIAMFAIFLFLAVLLTMGFIDQLAS
jgi:hypothetical protein